MASMFRSSEIRTGNFIVSNGKYTEVDKFFSNGPREVIKIEDNSLPYTGGKFVFIYYYGQYVGLYINGVKKA